MTMTYKELIALERATYKRASMQELRSIRMALAIHAWGNTLQEQARANAIEQIMHARLAIKMKGKAQ